MGNRRIARSLFAAIPLIVPASGCELLHPRPPINMEIIDAETQTPIDGASVRVWHSANHSVATSGTTGPDGMVQIPSPPADDTPLLYEMAAKGYMTRQTDHTVKLTQSSVVLEMYAEPRPTLELVVATGYRGVVRATVRVRDDYKYPPHQRLFSYTASAPTATVPPSILVEAVVPPLFGRGVTPDIRVRYADGTPLPRNAKDFEIGCRWLKSDPDGEYIFVIGTQWEADEIRRAIRKASGARPVIGEESITGFGRN